MNKKKWSPEPTLKNGSKLIKVETTQNEMKNLIPIFGAILFASVTLTSFGVGASNKEKNAKGTRSIGSDSSKKVQKNISEKGILKMYSKSGEIFDQECESKILLFIKSGIVKSIGIDCENEYGIFNYYEGNIIDLKIEGQSSLFDNCGGSGEGPTMCMSNEQFIMQFTSDSTRLEYNKMNYSISKLKYIFKTKDLKLYEAPNFSSKIIEEIKSDNLNIELIEIGNLEKNGGEWDVWYKVKSTNTEGWCFGNLGF